MLGAIDPNKQIKRKHGSSLVGDDDTQLDMTGQGELPKTVA
jgi:hypothetical protein